MSRIHFITSTHPQNQERPKGSQAGYIKPQDLRLKRHKNFMAKEINM